METVHRNTQHYLNLWALSDKAQYNNFLNKHHQQEIMVGFNRYRIGDNGYIDEKTNVPYVELVNVRTSSVHWVMLSLIDSEYTNFSAIVDEEKKDLLEHLGINPDEVEG